MTSEGLVAASLESLQCAQPGSQSSGAVSSQLSERSTGALRKIEMSRPRLQDVSEQPSGETQVPRSSQGYAQLLRRQPGLAFLLAAQAPSAFNHNAYKTILIFYALSHASSPAELAWMIPAAGGLRVIPYILFSSYAGQVADSFSKRSVIVTIKGLEIVLMTLATLAVFPGHIGVMMAVLFIEGTHSTFLSPAKDPNRNRAGWRPHACQFQLIVPAAWLLTQNRISATSCTFRGLPLPK